MSKIVVRKKIGKDDVILLNESLLPKEVKVIDGYNGFTTDKIYQVIGISWLTFPDRTRTIGYILQNDNGVIDIFMSCWFTVSNLRSPESKNG